MKSGLSGGWIVQYSGFCFSVPIGRITTSWLSIGDITFVRFHQHMLIYLIVPAMLTL